MLGCCWQDDRICRMLGAEWEGYGMTLQVTAEILTTQGGGKENELLGVKGTDQFVRFTGRTASLSGPIPVQLLFDPIGRIGLEL